MKKGFFLNFFRGAGCFFFKGKWINTNTLQLLLRRFCDAHNIAEDQREYGRVLAFIRLVFSSLEAFLGRNTLKKAVFGV